LSCLNLNFIFTLCKGKNYAKLNNAYLAQLVERSLTLTRVTWVWCPGAELDQVLLLKFASVGWKLISKTRILALPFPFPPGVFWEATLGALTSAQPEESMACRRKTLKLTWTICRIKFCPVKEIVAENMSYAGQNLIKCTSNKIFN